VSVVDDPNVENDFVFPSRQSQTSPPLEMSLTDFPVSFTTEEYTSFTHSLVWRSQWQDCEKLSGVY